MNFLNPELLQFIENLKPLLETIPEARKNELLKISRFIEDKRSAGEKAELIFICTHNSRRSHFGQIWGQTMAAYYGLDHVSTYSGGTEATAFHPNSIEAVKDAGFKVINSPNPGDTKNPVKEVYFNDDSKIIAFSKRYDHPANPQEKFCAVMTCSDADENCPIIHGAALRVSTPYDDPKQFDGTPLQKQKYAERCRQIASEMMFVMKGAK